MRACVCRTHFETISTTFLSKIQLATSLVFFLSLCLSVSFSLARTLPNHFVVDDIPFYIRFRSVDHGQIFVVLCVLQSNFRVIVQAHNLRQILSESKCSELFGIVDKFIRHKQRIPVINQLLCSIDSFN